MSTKPLTGRKVFAIVAGAFSVIIGVNLFMAWNAISSFPGLEVGNSYVASQSFDANREAQIALGWTASTEYAGGSVVLTIVDAAGVGVTVGDIDATIGRATHIQDDQALAFAPVGEGYRAPAALDPGYWQLRMAVTAQDGTLFQQRLEIYVDG